MPLNYRLCFFGLLCLCFGAACRSHNSVVEASEINKPIPDSVYTLLRAGDIVLRRGNDPLSDLFSSLNQRDPSYSHCGIAVPYQGGWMVCHMMDRPESNADTGDLRFEPLSSFVASSKVNAWALVRLDIDSIARATMIENLFVWKREKRNFDTHFDLKTDDALYCSELVYKAILPFLDDRYVFPLSLAHNGKLYVAPDNFYDQDFSTTIVQIEYK